MVVDMSTVVEGPHSPLPARRLGRVAILGAGRVGTALARGLVAAGYEVSVAGSGPKASIELIVEVVAPGATAADAAEAVAGADVVFLAVPLHRFATVDAEALRGRVVVDVMNHWEPVDGHLPDFSDAESTSEVVSRLLPETHVIKSFNHLGYHDIDDDRLPPGTHQRRAVAVAGDAAEAKASVMLLVDEVGFDPVDAGDLRAGALLEAGGEVFGRRMTAEELRRVLNR